MATIKDVEIDLMPTEGMKEEAERYQGWKADGEAGGTEVAARRATQILSGDELSPDVVIAMSAWFARHEVDKQAEGFSPGENGYPSPGRVAWAAWGGDPGQSWADAKADRIKEIQDRSMDTNRAEPGELSVGDFVEWQSSGGKSQGKIDRIETGAQIDVPNSDFTITGTDEDPAALITVYQENEEGWEASEVQVGHLFSALTKIEALRWKTGKTYQRSEMTAFDEVEDRTYEFPFSSEYPVERYFGKEILSHESGSADLSRLNDSAPLLFNHDPDRVIGVVEKAYLDDKKRKGYARVRFSRNAFAQEVLSDVKDGVLRNVSFGYSIDKMEERGSGDFVATTWTPYEVSIVSIPADPHQVGIGRLLSLNSKTLPRQHLSNLFLKWKTLHPTCSRCGPKPPRLSAPALLAFLLSAQSMALRTWAVKWSNLAVQSMKPAQPFSKSSALSLLRLSSLLSLISVTLLLIPSPLASEPPSTATGLPAKLVLFGR